MRSPRDAVARWTTLALLATCGAAHASFTDLWWDPTRPGTAVSVEDQGNVAFAIIFDYGPDGRPAWLVAPDMQRGGGGSYSSDLYSATRAPSSASTAGELRMQRVGSLYFDQTADSSPVYVRGSAYLWYTVEQESQDAFELRPYTFGTAPACNPGSDPPLPNTSFQGLWWNPADPGWAIHISDQRLERGNSIFALLATYGADGESTWLVASDVGQGSDGAFSGGLYRTHASGQSASRSIEMHSVGALRVAFTATGRGELSYTADGVPVTKPIERYIFGARPAVCRH